MPRTKKTQETEPNNEPVVTPDASEPMDPPEPDPVEYSKDVMDALNKIPACELALSDTGQPGSALSGMLFDATDARLAFKKFLTNPEPIFDAARRYIRDGYDPVGSDDTQKALNALSAVFQEECGTKAFLRL